MQIEYIPEMISVVIALLMCPVVPLVHIILSRITKSMLILRHTLIASIPYVIIWFIIVLYLKHYFLLNNFQFSRIIVGGACTIGFIIFGYMELISQPFRGFSLELLVNIYLDQFIFTVHVFLFMFIFIVQKYSYVYYLYVFIYICFLIQSLRAFRQARVSRLLDLWGAIFQEHVDAGVRGV